MRAFGRLPVLPDEIQDVDEDKDVGLYTIFVHQTQDLHGLALDLSLLFAILE
jgi:hypothetical protein